MHIEEDTNTIPGASNSYRLLCNKKFSVPSKMRSLNKNRRIRNPPLWIMPKCFRKVHILQWVRKKKVSTVSPSFPFWPINKAIKNRDPKFETYEWIFRSEGHLKQYKCIHSWRKSKWKRYKYKWSRKGSPWNEGNYNSTKKRTQPKSLGFRPSKTFLKRWKEYCL